MALFPHLIHKISTKVGILILSTLCFSFWLLLIVNFAIAGQVELKELPSAEAGRQWLDLGSLHKTKANNLRVLSNFAPSTKLNEYKNSSNLYLMDIDCAEKLYRDVSKNRMPLFNARWEHSRGDALLDSAINQACNLQPS